jgi:hypothetical protein
MDSVCTWPDKNLPFFLAHQLNFLGRWYGLSAIKFTDDFGPASFVCVPEDAAAGVPVFRLEPGLAFFDFFIGS